MRRQTLAGIFAALLLLHTIAFAQVVGPVQASPLGAPTPTQKPCEDWQKPDGQGGCVDRCGAGEQWKNNECVPKPCPADRIDLNGDGKDTGDCEPMDMTNVPRPASGANCSLVGDYGSIKCDLGGSFAGLSVYGAPGCVRVDRNFFPRVVVNRQVTFTASGILPTLDLPSTASNQGYYRTVPGQAWTTTGRTLGEEIQGTQAFSVTKFLRDGGDARPYPNIDNVVGYLQMQRTGGLEWNVSGQPSGIRVSFGTPNGDSVTMTFLRSSFPGPGTSMAMTGPNHTNTANNLPAYRLAVESGWTLAYVVSYDVYSVVGNAYTFGGRVNNVALSLVDSNNSLEFRRVVGGGIGGSLQNTMGIDYCTHRPNLGGSVSQSFVPVPVVEVQSVLR